MNYQKLQNDILKDFIKYPNGTDSFKRNFIGFAKYNKNICVLTNSCIYLIPKDVFYLDYEKLILSSKDFTLEIKQMLSIPKHIESAIKKDEIIVIDKTRKVNTFHLPIGNTDIYINKRFLSYFEDKKQYYYLGVDHKSPILVYDFLTDNLLGFILPIHPNGIKKIARPRPSKRANPLLINNNKYY